MLTLMWIYTSMTLTQRERESEREIERERARDRERERERMEWEHKGNIRYQMWGRQQRGTTVDSEEKTQVKARSEVRKSGLRMTLPHFRGAFEDIELSDTGHFPLRPSWSPLHCGVRMHGCPLLCCGLKQWFIVCGWYSASLIIKEKIHF